jgi:fluoride exporter
VPRRRTRTGASAAGADVALRLVAVAAGGSLGTLARYGLARVLAPPALGFPWPTFVANVAGSLLLGVIITLVVERRPSPRLARFVRPFAAIGFCGGFTTFSTLMVETAQFGRHERTGQAALYLVATIGAGLLAAALGIAFARWRLPSTGRGPIPDPDDLGPLHVGGAQHGGATDGGSPS